MRGNGCAKVHDVVLLVMSLCITSADAPDAPSNKQQSLLLLLPTDSSTSLSPSAASAPVSLQNIYMMHTINSMLTWFPCFLQMISATCQQPTTLQDKQQM